MSKGEEWHCRSMEINAKNHNKNTVIGSYMAVSSKFHHAKSQFCIFISEATLQLIMFVRMSGLGGNTIFSAPNWDTVLIFLCTFLSYIRIYSINILRSVLPLYSWDFLFFIWKLIKLTSWILRCTYKFTLLKHLLY